MPIDRAVSALTAQTSAVDADVLPILQVGSGVLKKITVAHLFGSELNIVGPTDSIQTAIDKVNAAGGGHVLLQGGQFNLTSDITVPSNVILEGNGATVIDFGGGAYQIKVVGDTPYKTGTVSINNASQSVVGSGTAFTVNMIGQSILLQELWYEITAVANATHLTIGSPYLGSNVSGGYFAIANTVSNVILKNFIVQNSSIAGIKIQYVNGIIWDTVTVVDCANGLDGDDSSTITMANGSISDCTAGMTWDYFHFGEFLNFNVSGCGPCVINNCRDWGWEIFTLSNSTGNGLTVTNMFNWGFVDFTLQHCVGHGIEFVSGCTDNGIAVGGILYNGGDGVKFTATNLRNTVIGCTIGNNTTYGINVAASSNTDNIIYPNTYNSNGSGTFHDLGVRTITGTNQVSKARAYVGINQSVATGTSTKVVLDTKTYDPGSSFDNVTNYRFTAPVAGDYNVVGKFVLQAPVDQTTIQIDVKKNGSDFMRQNVSASGTSDTGILITDTIPLAAGDYLEMFASHTSGSNKNVLAGENQSFLTVHLMSTG